MYVGYMHVCRVHACMYVGYMHVCRVHVCRVHACMYVLYVHMYMYVRVHVCMYMFVYISCSAQTGQHEACMCECCPVWALQLIRWNLLSKRHV